MGFACRAGALLLLHVLFPDHTTHLLDWITVPVAVADTALTVAQLLPQPLQRAARAAGARGRGVCADWAAGLEAAHVPLGWLCGVGGLAGASWHTLHALSGECRRWLWEATSSALLCTLRDGSCTVPNRCFCVWHACCLVTCSAACECAHGLCPAASSTHSPPLPCLKLLGCPLEPGPASGARQCQLPLGCFCARGSLLAPQHIQCTPSSPNASSAPPPPRAPTMYKTTQAPPQRSPQPTTCGPYLHQRACCSCSLLWR